MAIQPCRDGKLMMLRMMTLMTLTLIAAGDLFAGGGWVRQRGSLYVKTSFSWLMTNQFYTSNGKKISTADFTTWSLDSYAEVGIVNRLEGVLKFPLYKRSSFETTEGAVGIGDLMAELRYGLTTGAWPVALGVGIDFPTGDKNASAEVKDNPGAFIFLPTGDGEWNVRLNTYLSHAFEAVPAYISLDAGYNIRTDGFTDEYTVGLQAGYRMTERLGAQAFVRRMAPIRKIGDVTSSIRVGIGEGVQYTSVGGGLAYELIPGYTASFDYFTAVGKITNIYSGANLVMGLSFQN